MTRSSQLLHIPLLKSRSGQRTFYYPIISLWNSLDNSFIRRLSFLLVLAYILRVCFNFGSQTFHSIFNVKFSPYNSSDHIFSLLFLYKPLYHCNFTFTIVLMFYLNYLSLKSPFYGVSSKLYCVVISVYS